MTNIRYTIHRIDDGTILFSGDVAKREYIPAYDLETHMVTWDVEANPETEKIENGKAVPFLNRDRDTLLSEIVRQRKIRLAVGFDYDFGDDRGIHRIGTTDEDMISWNEVNTWAFKEVARGRGSVSTKTILSDTGSAVVTASEWLDILDAVEAFRQPLFTASFSLQSMDPIPQDVDNEAYWK